MVTYKINKFVVEDVKMRFYKAKKISKGVKVSISKSGGVRLGVGIPGFNISTGAKGMYLNTGIPGTGLSNRTKIGGKKSHTSKSRTSKQKIVHNSIRVHMEDNGEVVFYDDSDNLITDPHIINKIKRSPEYVPLVD